MSTWGPIRMFDTKRDLTVKNLYFTCFNTFMILDLATDDNGDRYVARHRVGTMSPFRFEDRGKAEPPLYGRSFSLGDVRKVGDDMLMPIKDIETDGNGNTTRQDCYTRVYGHRTTSIKRETMVYEGVPSNAIVQGADRVSVGQVDYGPITIKFVRHATLASWTFPGIFRETRRAPPSGSSVSSGISQAQGLTAYLTYGAYGQAIACANGAYACGAVVGGAMQLAVWHDGGRDPKPGEEPGPDVAPVPITGFEFAVPVPKDSEVYWTGIDGVRPLAVLDADRVVLQATIVRRLQFVFSDERTVGTRTVYGYADEYFVYLLTVKAGEVEQQQLIGSSQATIIPYIPRKGQFGDPDYDPYFRYGEARFTGAGKSVTAGYRFRGTFRTADYPYNARLNNVYDVFARIDEDVGIALLRTSQGSYILYDDDRQTYTEIGTNVSYPFYLGGGLAGQTVVRHDMKVTKAVYDAVMEEAK